MKVKVKNEIENIKLKCEHNEVILIRLALSYLKLQLRSDKEFNKVMLEQLNSLVFDCQEFDTDKDVTNLLNTMICKINSNINNIYPYKKRK